MALLGSHGSGNFLIILSYVMTVVKGCIIWRYWCLEKCMIIGWLCLPNTLLNNKNLRVCTFRRTNTAIPCTNLGVSYCASLP